MNKSPAASWSLDCHEPRADLVDRCGGAPMSASAMLKRSLAKRVDEAL